MAKPSLEIIRIIRDTAKKLEASNQYQWGHMGSCNCGFIAQEVTKFTKAEIHRRAMMNHGDWTEQLNDYCPVSGRAMDEIILTLIEFGFDIDDLKHLENLSDPQILSTLPAGVFLQFNVKSHAVRYLNLWANLLEEMLLNNINLPSLYADKTFIALTERD